LGGEISGPHPNSLNFGVNGGPVFHAGRNALSRRQSSDPDTSTWPRSKPNAARAIAMSALPQWRDMADDDGQVRKVPDSDIATPHSISFRPGF